MDLTSSNTTVLTSICYYAPNVNSTIQTLLILSYTFALGLFMLNIGLSVSVGGSLKALLILIIQLLLVTVFAALTYAIKWSRPPEIYNAANCVVSRYGFAAINKYGFPEVIFIPQLVILVYLIFERYRQNKKDAMPLMITLAILFLLVFTVAEFTLGRLYFLQYLANVAIIVVVILALCLTIYFGNVTSDLVEIKDYNIKRIKILQNEVIILKENNKMIDDYINNHPRGAEKSDRESSSKRNTKVSSKSTPTEETSKNQQPSQKKKKK